ncbi:hypothetical protein GCM10011575_08430 [Microlunatus endophyticus]|uniref:Polysaccharide pyruvyl transferase family protein WcaK n=1 Tax=Microlunatus endophyticus TaxID=1716077 RepID=A0A917S227_9ACTN|nr:hypothetical protein [Microlunatus endophyticus]GGL52394.1 hypothetical protein GCM10011575_08430 [Microlunatus endophyticus]
MNEDGIQDVFAHLSGQDDNLGDSALRAGYFLAAQGDGRRFHLHFGVQSDDYLSGLPLTPAHRVYADPVDWLEAGATAFRPVLLLNTGEINPLPGAYPRKEPALQLQRVLGRGGIVILAGAGLRQPSVADQVCFHPALREAALVSWRDTVSRDAAGFGDVAPDWGYALGSPTAQWPSADSRPLLAVTLRYDRPWPGDGWIAAVRSLAARTGTRIVTLAQVARDAPRAVRLAAALGGEYRTPPSMRHPDLDAHVRAIYRQSLAVVSDRAHGLIIGATEGAFPVGSADDPQKIARLLAVAGLADLVGRHDQLAEVAPLLESKLAGLVPAIDSARESIATLTLRMHQAMRSVA